MNIRKCRKEDATRICELLDSHDLPTADIAEANLDDFIVAETNNKIIGVCGIERNGFIGLVRSLAVDRDYSGHQTGQTLYKKIEQHAVQKGIIRLYILTTTADAYFSNFGYEILDKALSPVPIKNSKQFSRLCPESAILMHKSLSPVDSKINFDTGFYCAESVLSAVADHYEIQSDLIPKIATGFCSGMSRTCGTCGALTGGILAINLISGREQSSESIESNYEAVQVLVDEFTAMYGTTNCQQLLDCDLGSGEGQQKFTKQKLSKKCREYTGMSADIAVNLLEHIKMK